MTRHHGILMKDLAEALTSRGWLGGLLLISGMIVSQWNSERRPAAALALE